MMMEILYVRHGETSYSRKNLFMGRKNLPILMQKKDEFLATIKAVINFSPEIVICSPLLRAKQSLEVLNVDIKPVFTSLLLERDFGNYESMPKTPYNRQSLEKDPSVESLESIHLRVKKFIYLLQKKPSPTLVVGHSGFYKILKTYALNKDSVKNEILPAGFSKLAF
ncbi:histidine phosphatase family protein [Pseudoalteromonas piscicida]|uniref:histidine phosphatase family protein n=1 Tax=Pseudoalteromonas piscicida TaxID=43662 RepID=UPI0030AF260A